MNELAVHPKGDYLAAADDSGTVKVYNTRTRRVDKTLQNAHTVRRRRRRCCSCCLFVGDGGGSGGRGAGVTGVAARVLALVVVVVVVTAVIESTWLYFPLIRFRTANRPHFVVTVANVILYKNLCTEIHRDTSSELVFSCNTKTAPYGAYVYSLDARRAAVYLFVVEARDPAA